jgi:hypothetical protein
MDWNEVFLFLNDTVLVLFKKKTSLIFFKYCMDNINFQIISK